jgi:2-isopropylmalate synthase
MAVMGVTERGEELIYDWNTVGDAWRPAGPVMLDDETLRDGLQSPSVTDPPLATKLRLVHLMDELGIDTADVGLPGAGPRAVADVTAICKEIAGARLKIKANCAARTHANDIDPIVQCSQAAGIPIEACLFIGSSPIRQYTEGWEFDTLLSWTEKAVSHAVREKLPVMFVTEDTTRARPEDLRRLYTVAIECGATRVCVSDTVGHATPEGVARLLAHMREVIKATGREVGIDWHGHKDRGLSVANVLAAIRAGATRVHGAGIGIGERAGNAPMELILVNLHLLGWSGRPLGKLAAYCDLVSSACGVPIPRNYPVVGADAFETATGVHAAAVIKAFKKGDRALADRVYSSVPAGELGLEQKIRVGPMSGRSNVVFWLEKRGFEATDARVDTIFKAAKSSPRLLEDAEMLALIQGS